MGITVSGQMIAILVSIISIGVIIIIAIIVAHIAQVRRTSKLPTRSEFNALVGKVSELQVAVAAVNGRIDSVHGRIDTVVGRIDAVSDRIDAVNDRIDALPTQESIDAAIRASEARIIKALINHRHPEPAGPPVFTEPL